MGIKNRKEKAIFNKQQKTLGTKNSPFLNTNDNSSKELSKIKTMKFSKEFLEFRNKNKNIHLKDENVLEKKNSNLVNIQSNNTETLENPKSNIGVNASHDINVSSYYKKNDIVNIRTNKLISKQHSRHTNKEISEDIGASRQDTFKKEKIIKDNSEKKLRSKTLIEGPKYKISKITSNQSKSIALEKSKSSENIGSIIKSKKFKVVDKSNLISKDLDNEDKESNSRQHLLLEGLRKEKVIKDFNSQETVADKGQVLAGNISKSKIKDRVDSGPETDDIGVKSLSSVNKNFEDSTTFIKKIRSKNKSRIISKNTRHFNHRKIMTKVGKKVPGRNTYIKAKIKEEVVKNVYKENARSQIVKTRLESIKNKVMQVGKFTFSKGLVVFFLVLFLLTTVFAVGNGNISTSASFVILTTDEQNEAYLQYYEELKADLKEEIDDLVVNSNHDYVVIDGLDSNGNLYDLDFTEWIAILTVKIEQDFKLSNNEYKYLKEIFNKMIYYKAHVETETSTDSEGNTETTTTLVITVINEYYPQIKDYLGFNNEDLEWVERLIEYDSLSDRIDNIPSNSEYVDGGGNLSPEEIEKYGGQMVHPLNGLGRISSPYGYRVHPIHGTRKFHSGIDLAIGQGTPIYSAQDGVVIHSGPMGGYGLTIMIQHDNGVVTLYAHCSSLVARVDQYVSKGDHISNVGSTGQSTGPHLHFEVRVDGSTVNPLSFINH